MNAIDQLLRAGTVSALCADPPVITAYDSDFAAHAGELAAFASAEAAPPRTRRGRLQTSSFRARFVDSTTPSVAGRVAG